MPQCLTPKIVLLLLLCSLTAHAQLPDCEHIYLKKLNDEGVYNYNPTLPVSATNPVKNTISIPESFGLTVSHVLGSDPSVLTFYSVELSSGNYIYYDPVSKDWLNTRHKTGSPYAVNIAAGGKYIFNLDGVNGKVYRYDGTQPEVLITTVSDFVGGAPYDLVTDCEGNWYILNLRSTTPFLRKYNAEGTLLHSWVIYNPSGISVESGAGFAIIGTNLYTDNTATGGGITLYSMGKDTVEVLRTTSDNVLSVGDDLGCCAGNVPTRPEVTLKATKTVLCDGSEPVNFSAVPLAGGSAPVYQWLVNGIPVGSGTPDFSYSPANGDKIVCVMTSNSPCASPPVVSSDTIRITVYEELPKPPVVISPLTYCKGIAGMPLSATTTVAGSQLNWYTSATGGTPDLAPPVPPTGDTGTFIYYVAEGDGDCISPRVPIRVNVSEVILSDVTMSHPAAYESLDGFIRFKANKVHELYTINYRINGVPQPELSLSSDASGYIIISKLGNGLYDKITVTDALGCSGYIDAIELAFCTTGQAPMPNSFTPNGDHINDVFYVRGSGFTVKRFYIYDRLGNLVFSKENFPPNDPQYGWDGKMNGKVISDAAGFVYMLETLCQGMNTPVLTKGAVLMIR